MNIQKFMDKMYSKGIIVSFERNKLGDCCKLKSISGISLEKFFEETHDISKCFSLSNISKEEKEIGTFYSFIGFKNCIKQIKDWYFEIGLK